MNRFLASAGFHDPIRGFNYEVIFSGRGKQIHRTGFNSVTGVKVQLDFQEYKEGGNNGIPVKIPKDVNYEPITMKNGMVMNSELAQAFASQFTNLGAVGTNTYTVDIYRKDRDGKTVVRHVRLTGVFISRYEESDMDAQKSEIAVETIIITFTGVEYPNI